MRYYEEAQCWDDHPERWDGAIHWDLVAAGLESQGVFNFLTKVFELASAGYRLTMFSDAGPNDPLGVFWVRWDPPTVEPPLGVMLRNKWWEIPIPR